MSNKSNPKFLPDGCDCQKIKYNPINYRNLLAIIAALFTNLFFGQSNNNFVSIEMEIQFVESLIRGTLLIPDSTAQLPVVIVVPVFDFRAMT